MSINTNNSKLKSSDSGSTLTSASFGDPSFHVQSRWEITNKKTNKAKRLEAQQQKAGKKKKKKKSLRIQTQNEAIGIWLGSKALE